MAGLAVGCIGGGIEPGPVDDAAGPFGFERHRIADTLERERAGQLDRAGEGAREPAFGAAGVGAVELEAPAAGEGQDRGVGGGGGGGGAGGEQREAGGSQGGGQTRGCAHGRGVLRGRGAAQGATAAAAQRPVYDGAGAAGVIVAGGGGRRWWRWSCQEFQRLCQRT